ncbi:glycoside hydrolase family 35 protein [Agromyces albus]|uniref:Beta-galactosidase n=1 Tax=Agromyces albus TaxID=205332 RepID=A0A4Q2L0B7_9MICO|nr:beta-galactosidase family protein [Agromyces albus]RXZ71434.1 beta-galactosidase [Agromyces albus]
MPEFAIGADDFLLDGKPHQIISGAMHYFRVHPEQWADRIRKARLMGLNTIETYVAWNAHAPRRGEFITDGGLDLGRYLSLIAAEGMHAIVRPGPYICAEWDNGGLPAWLLRDAAVRPRSSEPTYLDAVTEFLRQVYEIVAPLQVQHGGPVVLVQIENEYGAYGDDKDYLAELVRVTRESGITLPLTTIDQPVPEMLEAGRLPGLHMTASFGSRSVERLATLREFQPTGPLMCMEFWDGWFDSWGTHHHTTSAEQSASDLDALLAAGGSVNLYMFHGGTNFGLTNGANHKGRYLPITTSYDYDAPLDEAGNPTEKYFAFRDVIAKYAPVPDEQPAASAPALAFDVPLEVTASLLAVEAQLGERRAHHDLPTFDELHHDRGLALYSTQLEGDGGAGILSFGEVRDRAWLFLDGVPVGVLSRDAHERVLALPAARGELTVLVEDQGRVDYGTRIGEEKGLIGGARLDGVPITGWSVTPLDLERVPGVATASLRGGYLPAAADAPAAPVAGPVLAHASFTLGAATDLFLDTSAWGKGFAWINDFALGRYWRRGPQQTLYVPGPATRDGVNELVVLELDVFTGAGASFVDRPSLGHTEV